MNPLSINQRFKTKTQNTEKIHTLHSKQAVFWILLMIFFTHKGAETLIQSRGLQNGRQSETAADWMDEHTCEELRSHMNRCAHNTARHHGLWFAEPQVSDFGSIPFVKL